MHVVYLTSGNMSGTVPIVLLTNIPNAELINLTYFFPMGWIISFQEFDNRILDIEDIKSKNKKEVVYIILLSTEIELVVAL